MIFEAKEVLNVISVMKYFLRQEIDERLRYVIFSSDGFISAQNPHAGMLYFPNFEIPDSFALSLDMFVKLGALLQDADEVNIKIAPKNIIWKVKNSAYKTAKIDSSGICPPMPSGDSSLSLNSSFKDVISNSEFSISQDVRQQAIYGAYINGGSVFACDNVRGFTQQSGAVLDISNLFLSKEFIEILRKINFLPIEVSIDKNIVFFYYPKFIIFSALVGHKYPNLVKIFEKIDADDVIATISEYSDSRNELLQLAPIVNDSKFGNALNVEIENGQMKLFTLSRGGGEEFESIIKIKSTNDSKVCFKINSVYLLEGMQRFNFFTVHEKLIYFTNDAGMKHFIMLMN